ncbi:T9SS type A sorting domain-containing protein [Hymenobacter armeniacus]|uniref:T9SS type A sorting domain-containing protein n=1 Tax=Hymenobacter armeniacus TaxID=2771358 RepID=A0ABR8JSZ9_9BACT|nr:T9SS type A sorting domain-containing protein [Hymenobacter armeniacus]MBD2721908.1 T9SS type A sorting domain-containing protein [Hymenobacter armeniacus]
MKRNSLAVLGLSLFVTLATGLTALAQPQHRPGGGPGRAEVQAYMAANVQPVLRQQRQQLESQLAAEDRAQLATYRTQLRALQAQGQALRQSLHPAGTAPGQRPEPTDAQRQQLHQLHRDMRDIMLKVSEMAQKYDAALTKLAAEMQPQREKWNTDIHAIVLKNATPEQQAHMARFEWRGHGGQPRFFRAAKFLLMDANAPAAAAEPTLGATSFYPNPAAATTQMEYEMKKTGPVSVDLLDATGTKLRPLFTESQAEKGAHAQQLDLHDLPAGTYFYKITTKSGSETKRFVKE